MPRVSTKLFVVGVFLAASGGESLRRQISKHEALELQGDQSTDSCGLANPYFNISGAKDMCNVCIGKSSGWTKCKWCPLSQTCVRSGFWFGESCEPREGHPEDVKIKEASECGTRTPPWAKLMDEAYGAGWQMNREKHIDAIRCIQWGLGWPIESESGFHESENTANQVGRWSCASALLREAMRAALGFKELPTSQLQVSQAQAELSSFVQTNASASVGKPWWYDERQSWSPPLCSIIQKKLMEEDVKGFLSGYLSLKNDCYVRAWQVESFKKLVGVVGSPNAKDHGLLEKLRASVDAGPLVTFDPGAGKSGSGFAKLGDGKYLMKLGLKYQNSMNEPQNLMTLVKNSNGTEPLLEHYQQHPDSLLNRYYGMLKIALGNMRSYAILIDDGFYRMDGEAKKEMKSGKALSFTRYDLKGASRNQNEMKHTGFSLLNGDFKARENATIKLAGEQCLTMRSAVASDAAFLEEHNIIDYSLLLMSVNKKLANASSVNLQGMTEARPKVGDEVRIIRGSPFTLGTEGRTGTIIGEDQSPLPFQVQLVDGRRFWYKEKEMAKDYLTCASTPGEPFCVERGNNLYTLSIIDYLNDYNAFKALESVFVKWGKFWGYSKSVNVYAKKICPTPTELVFKNQLKQLIRDSNGSIENAFKDIDSNNSGKVSKGELEEYFKTIGLSKADAERIYEDLMDAVDADGNVDFAAFSYLFD